MEELKLLIEMVAKLPNTALWVLLGYLVYKLSVVGSIFGLIRYAIWAVHSWMTRPKHEDIRPILDGMTIRASLPSLVAQLHRLKGRGTGIDSEYIHQRSIDWLREAIDDKIAKEAANGKQT